MLSVFSSGSLVAGQGAESIPSDTVSTNQPSEVPSIISPDLRPCSYQQLTPGQSKLGDVLEQLGTPAEESVSDGERILTYVKEPFAQVQIFHSNEVVTSIILHLREPAPASQIAKELEVEGFDPTPIVSETGQLLGRAFPERGVLLNFAVDSPASKVSELVLEPIGPELFVLRAKQDTRHRYQQNLADLETALLLDPANVAALSNKAKVLSATGQYVEALSVIDQLLPLIHSEPSVVLQRAELLVSLERHEEARTAVKSIVDDQSVSAIVRARAECQLGSLLSVGPERNFTDAIQHHLAAIKLASPHASDRLVEVRREAKRILLDAFLGASHDIAMGKWQQQEETVSKWLDSARELADAFIARDGGDEVSKLRVQLATIAAHASMGSDIDPARLVAGIQRESKRLAEASGDRLFERSIGLHQARALLDAASIEHGRDAKLKAFDYATQAAEILDPLAASIELSASDQYLAGRLYFFVGSSHAVIHRNHAEAVRWYDKAMDCFVGPLPASGAGDLGRHGERLVSMGASYWETENRDKGLDLTRRGLEMMKQAEKQGLVAKEQLALPYGNLAAMYQSLGKPDEAKNFAEIASRLGDTSSTGQSRR